MYKIQVKLKSFCVANRLRDPYKGACNNLHGHNYAITITLGAKKLDEYGFVMDFSKVKELCNNWLEQHWDHGVILNAQDTTLLKFLKQDKQKYFLLPGNMQPSSENLAKYAFDEFSKMIQQAELLKIEIAETTDSIAIYEKPSNN
jgi:6-pyruvoyltetrahydropterin/6-carboxytetrahydropterin synthase